jgi:sulfite reductase beta subunit-like hemoprotein
VYHQDGRRDNDFKARIEILVNELGAAESLGRWKPNERFRNSAFPSSAPPTIRVHFFAASGASAPGSKGTDDPAVAPGLAAYIVRLTLLCRVSASDTDRGLGHGACDTLAL